MPICGIYKITNKINGKSYIGQAIDIERRWQIHKSTKDNLPIHRAIQKYGKDNFIFSILEECEREELNEKEIYYIREYHTCVYDKDNNGHLYGYNLTYGGEGGTQVPVLQYNKNGDFICKFDSMSAAASFIGRSVTQISMCCNGRCVSCGGYLWSYLGEKPQKYKGPGESSKIKIDQYSLDGKFLRTFDSVTEAIKKVENAKNIGEITCCCKKENASAYGYLWRFHGDSPPKPYIDKYFRKIQQLTFQDEIVNVYNSLDEASKKTNILKSNICYCCKGKRKTAGGYKWRYID